MNTPVLFLIFNRPDITQRVFHAIRGARPSALFIAADGPRENYPNDAVRCAETRKVIDQIDWPCQVSTLFRKENLGCRKAVSEAITWFFSEVEEGIILEDDCLPHPDFFTFCNNLLERYRNDPSVMHIAGSNFQFGKTRGNASYYFSRIAHIWGWASWRRAWLLYRVDMPDFPSFLERGKSFFIDKQLEKYWLFHFRRMYKGADTWDYQWTYAVMKNNGYCIIPNKNLISNIGFGVEATHSFEKTNPVANMRTFEVGTLMHPMLQKFDDEADRYTVETAFPIPPLYRRGISKIQKIIKQFFQ